MLCTVYCILVHPLHCILYTVSSTTRTPPSQYGCPGIPCFTAVSRTEFSLPLTLLVSPWPLRVTERSLPPHFTGVVLSSEDD